MAHILGKDVLLTEPSTYSGHGLFQTWNNSGISELLQTDSKMRGKEALSPKGRQDPSHPWRMTKRNNGNRKTSERTETLKWKTTTWDATCREQRLGLIKKSPFRQDLMSLQHFLCGISELQCVGDYCVPSVLPPLFCVGSTRGYIPLCRVLVSRSRGVTSKYDVGTFIKSWMVSSLRNG